MGVTTEATIAKQLVRRREAVARLWNLGRELVLIGAGDPVPIPGRGDRVYPFRSHSEYFYLTDRERPGGVLALDPEEGWIDFLTPVSRDEEVWEGAAPHAEDDAVPGTELSGWLASRRERRIAVLGSPVAGIRSTPELESELRRGLNQVRRRKDSVELERMRAAERATRAGFARLASLIAPGQTERALQIELEAEFFRHGADQLAFDTIVGSGPNSAVLHFAPSRRELEPGDLVLVDAGGECRGYASDVTRTYPASAAFDSQQAELHELVRRAGEIATSRCTPGTEFTDVHRAAAVEIGEGLAAFGLLRGDPESLVERGTVSLFFPHGIGHMVGLGVRDASEHLPGRQVSGDVYPGLRMNLPLEPGHVVTIEPGIYFVASLLRDPTLRARHRDTVDWERAERLIGFGGIRIEQNVLVTEAGPDVLTAGIPV